MSGALSRVGRIALNEATRTGRGFDRRAMTLLLLVALASAFVLPAAFHRGLDFDHGIYRVAVTSDSPLLPVVEAAPVFAVTIADAPLDSLASGTADLAIAGANAQAPDSEKGHAALAALADAAKSYTFTLMTHESDQAAAFPVRVTLVYEARPSQGAAPGAPSASAPQVAPPSTGGSSADAPLPSAPASGFALLPQTRSVNTPETLAPPFPFRSLVLAYFFLIPMNFVVQVYSGSLLNERIQRRGEALLASPARPWEIILGKTLPYATVLLASTMLVAYSIGGGWLSVVAVAPLAFTFLALQFVGGMFARSFRELTFLTVFTSVLLTLYAFLPAIFADVHPVAFVSPITLVVLDLRHEVPTLGEALYALAPLTLVAIVLFRIGAALYREEDLFHQKPVPSKAIDALARQVRRLASGFWLAILLIPFVFVAELLLVAFLFAWPVPTGLLGALLAVAVVEEFFKAAPSYAAVSRGRVAPRKAAAFGALVGLGFFVAEKGFLLASLVGLFNVGAGAAVFGTSGVTLPAGAGGLVVAMLLVGPLALHTATASLTGWAATRGKRVFALGFFAAVAIHTAYNATILHIVGGA
ncbi:MAG: PrsW family intramembrane metalloprotease [Thermoplasmatota archaeon]